MPVETMARRGEDTLRFGPLKPVGLVNPHTGKTPYAVIQLRRDNAEGTVYNMVGFQTHLKFGEQKRVFSMIPGLENAEFLRSACSTGSTALAKIRVFPSPGSLPAWKVTWSRRHPACTPVRLRPLSSRRAVCLSRFRAQPRPVRSRPTFPADRSAISSR